jgi:hypothetical protein
MKNISPKPSLFKLLLAIFIASTLSSCTGVSYGYFNRHEVKFSEKPKVSLVVFVPSNFDLSVTSKSNEPNGAFKEEIVPRNQSFDDWKEKITISINQNSSLKANQFFDSLSQESQKKCGDNFNSFNSKWREDGSDVIGSILCGNGEQDFLRIFNSQYGLILISYTTKAKPYDAKVYTPISITDITRLRNSFGFAFVCEGGLGSCLGPTHNTESVFIPRQKLTPPNEERTIAKNITNIRTKGSLQKTHDLPCIGINEAKNTYTPADLYASFEKCVSQNNNKKAIELYTLAGAYALYDVMRISDQTVVGGIKVMITNLENNIGTKKKEKFVKYAKEFKKTPEAEILCDKIKNNIGKPNYYPEYLILHGISAIFINELARTSGMKGKIEYDGLKKNYDAEKNWSEAINAYSGCRK